MYIISVASFCIAEFIYGRYSRKQNQNTEVEQVSLHQIIVKLSHPHATANKEEKQGFQLKENIAYGPILMAETMHC